MESGLSSIKNWTLSERPRERLLEQGAGVVSDAELVAILLRSGIRRKHVVELSRELIASFGGLRGLFAADRERLQSVKGLGKAKAATILAVSELARRQLREEILGKNIIRDPQSVIAYLYTALRDQKKEIFKVIFLNKANQVIQEKDLFTGTVDETAVHPREVVKAALEYHATGLVLVHNHPSGRIQPSPEDRHMTQKIQTACETVNIKILDHLIVGDNHYFSFREHQLIH